MRKQNFVIAAIVVTVSLATIWACNSSTTKANNDVTVLSKEDLVKRGEYLVATIGCDDCHSPKRMGAHGPEVIPELRLSGYPASRPVQKPDSNVIKQGWALMGADLTSAVGPWGMSFSANITSDETGIGTWTENNFIQAIRLGKIKGLENNRGMLPPMPWYNFAKLTDEDLKAMFAYLKSTPAVANRVPPPQQLADIK